MFPFVYRAQTAICQRLIRDSLASSDTSEKFISYTSSRRISSAVNEPCCWLMLHMNVTDFSYEPKLLCDYHFDL